MKLLAFCFFFSLCYFSLAQHPSSDPTYQLVFEDEFNGAGVNDSLWDLKFPWNQPALDSICLQHTCDTCSACSLWSKQAYRLWQNDTHNIKISGGTARLFVRKENYYGEFWNWVTGNPNTIISHHWTNYTSGMLYSKSEFRFGWFEIKFKLPQTPVLHNSYQPFGANFWLYGGTNINISTDPDSINWSEIDVFEIFDGQTNYYDSNVHFGAAPMAKDSSISPPDIYGRPAKGPISANEWHIAAADWRPDRIDFYLDGEIIKTVTEHVDSLTTMPMIVDINAPKDFQIPGPPQSLSNSFVSFPYIYELDYVKVWQMITDCNTDLYYCNFDTLPTPYDNSLVNSFTTGGDSCVSTFDNTPFFNHSTSYILLQENTTITDQAGATFIVDGICPTNSSYHHNSPAAPPPISFYSKRR